MKYSIMMTWLSATLLAGGAKATLISVDFNESGQAYNMSGVEADWVGLGNQWNILSVSSATEVNPAWTALIDSDGNATTVGLALTGTVDSWRGVDLAENSTGLLKDYLFGATEISWTLSGLAPGGTYDMWVYSSYNSWNDVSVSSQSQTAHAYGGSNYTTSPPRSNGLLLNDLVADGSGVIAGTVAGGYEWAGFQLQQVSAVPEPGTAALLALGLLALGWTHRRAGRSPA